MEGEVKRGGVFVGDSLKPEMLSNALKIWINDSYWLVMPFKLKDSGVTLKLKGESTTQSGIDCHVLTLTFSEVGVTPGNKYDVWVDKEDHLVKQWAYYRDASQDTANFIRPWDNYQKVGNLLISADRSDGAGPGNVKLLNDDPKIFTLD